MIKRLDEITLLEEERVSALENQEARTYALLCNELGINDVEDSYLYASGLNYDRAEEEYFSQIAERLLENNLINKVSKKPRKKRVRKRQIEYDNLVISADKEHVDVDNVFADIGIKARHLREIMGYSHLIVGKGEKISLSDAKPNRIGEVYKKCYDMGEK
jgi:hypothetical protein